MNIKKLAKIADGTKPKSVSVLKASQPLISYAVDVLNRSDALVNEISALGYEIHHGDDRYGIEYLRLEKDGVEVDPSFKIKDLWDELGDLVDMGTDLAFDILEELGFTDWEDPEGSFSKGNFEIELCGTINPLEALKKKGII